MSTRDDAAVVALLHEDQVEDADDPALDEVDEQGKALPRHPAPRELDDQEVDRSQLSLFLGCRCSCRASSRWSARRRPRRPSRPAHTLHRTGRVTSSRPDERRSPARSGPAPLGELPRSG